MVQLILLLQVNVCGVKFKRIKFSTVLGQMLCLLGRSMPVAVLAAEGRTSPCPGWIQCNGVQGSGLTLCQRSSRKDPIDSCWLLLGNKSHSRAPCPLVPLCRAGPVPWGCCPAHGQLQEGMWDTRTPKIHSCAPWDQHISHRHTPQPVCYQEL